MPEVEELPESKCRQLLGGGVFGRIGLCTPDGPLVLPVNYSVVAESIIIRTAADGVVSRHPRGARMAFEVDHVDYGDQKGWSVVAVGPASPIDDPDEVAHVLHTWEPRPWASGARPLYVRLAWDTLTGRRLGAGWTYATELPVRREV